MDNLFQLLDKNSGELGLKMAKDKKSEKNFNSSYKYALLEPNNDIQKNIMNQILLSLFNQHLYVETVKDMKLFEDYLSILKVVDEERLASYQLIEKLYY